jgi:hypothetical protein
MKRTMRTTAWHEIVRDTWAGLITRYPPLRWVQRWGISTGSLLLGLLTLLVFRRGIEYFPWFIGYLLLLWLAGVAFAEVRLTLAARGRRMVWVVVDYTIQSLLHGLLVFLLPIYYASTTLASGNVGFLILLAAAALLTTIDPWYRAVILRYRRIEILLFGFGLFASLNVAFPLLRVRSAWGLILSGVVSMLALTPVFRRGAGTRWGGAFLRAGMGAALVALFLWPVRAWIPPVPLQLTQATFARSVTRLEPEQPASVLAVHELRTWGGVAAFTAVAAPAGLREPLYHVWRRNGTIVAKIPLSPISGGRSGGFRTYSRKTDLGPNPAGSWTVDVLTTSGQLIGRVRLAVTP